MKTVTFNRKLWELNSFESISYDKNKKLLFVHFFNDKTIKFHNISENIIFQFLVEQDKDSFIEKILMQHYVYDDIS
ncbi:KTSC domain-containing protein [Gracilibacillus sp. YIM 98692]|uniref:KTSC domain-containing protein n=1 Tax=Gracilibacillus sp. YIM 98692 TaxID=2663532 RepID=UPI001F09CDE5|nr:KTSC domain-containing protein [Gracilibacillus sp. YIM 98692]